MALLPSSSSSTRDRGFNYGVFLSCGTEDTLEFTGLLYQALCNRGIRTFTDCEVVDEITPALEEAIQTSRIAIVVLSNNYASSSFCLDKLSKILDHFKSKVHPVFYQVDPDDVQMLRGTYGEAIAMHKKRFNDRIQKWTMALQQVSNLPGWQFGLGNEYDHQDFIRKIVKEVFNKIVYIPIVTREDEDGIKVTCLSEGISEISFRFDGKNKVMLIVDDVDKLEQLQQVKADKHLLGLNALTDKEAIEMYFDKTIHNMLKERFYSLKMAEKRVFLDIVCYGEGYHLVDVQHILRAHYGCCVTDYIRVLVDKSLIYISPRGEKTLNHWAECMGTELVQLESPKEPGKRSRLWIPEDIFHVLEDGTGTDKIEIICLDLSSTKEKKIDWNGDGFKNMGNLKTLIIKNAHFSQAPRHLPSSLRVLEWKRYPSQYLPPNFHPENLALCKLPKRCFVSSEIGDLLNKKPASLDDLSFDKGEHSNEMFYVSCLPKSEEMNVMVSY